MVGKLRIMLVSSIESILLEFPIRFSDLEQKENWCDGLLARLDDGKSRSSSGEDSMLCRLAANKEEGGSRRNSSVFKLPLPKGCVEVNESAETA